MTNLAEAERVLTGRRPAASFVASGLEGKACSETIRWFAHRTRGIIVALLEDCDRQRQEALEAGASYICSKPDLLVMQLRHELAARLGCAAPGRPLGDVIETPAGRSAHARYSAGDP